MRQNPIPLQSILGNVNMLGDFFSNSGYQDRVREMVSDFTFHSLSYRLAFNKTNIKSLISLKKNLSINH